MAALRCLDIIGSHVLARHGLCREPHARMKVYVRQSIYIPFVGFLLLLYSLVMYAASSHVVYRLPAMALLSGRIYGALFRGVVLLRWHGFPPVRG
jgi:hypothetical protein